MIDGPAGAEQDRAWLQVVAAAGPDAEKALEALFRKYRRPLLAFLLQRRLDEGTAEDLVQEVFVRVVRAAGTFRNEAKVSSWLFQIARNLHLDHLRKANIEDTADDETWQAIEGAIADEGDAAGAEALQDCFDRGYGAFARAFPEPAQVLHKVVQLDWSTREVAQFLQRTEGATREYLSQCRKKLRRYLEPCRELLVDA